MNRPDPLTPEERELARLLGRPAPPAPPAAVDEAVLAAARAAIQPSATDDHAAAATPVRGTARPRSRLPAVFGLAASLVFAVGIAWQLKPDAPPPAAPVPAAAEAAADATPAPSADANAAAATAEVAAPASAEPATPTAAEKPQAARTVSAPKTAPVPLPPPAPPVALRTEAPASPAPMAAPMAAPSPSDARVDADEAAALDKVVTGSRISQSRERTQAKGAPGVMRRAAPAPATAYGALSADAITVAVDADAALPRRQWLKRIRERRAEGDVDTARASLERYLQQYPEARIPRDLRELLDPH